MEKDKTAIGLTYIEIEMVVLDSICWRLHVPHGRKKHHSMEIDCQLN